jgi:hypothetical protein
MATSKGVADGKRQRKPNYSVQETLFLAKHYMEFRQFAVILAKDPNNILEGACCIILQSYQYLLKCSEGNISPCCRMLNIRDNNVRVIVIPSLKNQ